MAGKVTEAKLNWLKHKSRKRFEISFKPVKVHETKNVSHFQNKVLRKIKNHHLNKKVVKTKFVPPTSFISNLSSQKVKMSKVSKKF